MINSHQICIRCSLRNTNSKYFDKIWLLVKYSLLAMMYADVSINLLVATSADRLVEQLPCFNGGLHLVH